VALEEPNISVLNYAPGILNTDISTLLKTEGFNKQVYNDPVNIIQPEVSAAKMINVLEQKKYKNGQHLDFYDVK
jgi:hypothetical protein